MQEIGDNVGDVRVGQGEPHQLGTVVSRRARCPSQNTVRGEGTIPYELPVSVVTRRPGNRKGISTESQCQIKLRDKNKEISIKNMLCIFFIVQ